jgi:hypothetical protein
MLANEQDQQDVTALEAKLWIAREGCLGALSDNLVEEWS